MWSWATVSVLKATLNGEKDASVASGQCPEAAVEDKCQTLRCLYIISCWWCRASFSPSPCCAVRASPKVCGPGEELDYPDLEALNPWKSVARGDYFWLLSVRGQPCLRLLSTRLSNLLKSSWPLGLVLTLGCTLESSRKLKKITDAQTPTYSGLIDLGCDQDTVI